MRFYLIVVPKSHSAIGVAFIIIGFDVEQLIRAHLPNILFFLDFKIKSQVSNVKILIFF
jgi:hypothetical protein